MLANCLLFVVSIFAVIDHFSRCFLLSFEFADVKVDNEMLNKLVDKLKMTDETIKGKKNEVHIISAAELDDDIQLEKHGWEIEKENYEAYRVKIIEEADDEDDVEQSLKRLERQKNRAETKHEGALEKLKLDLANKREKSEREVKRLNDEIENLRVFRKKVAAELDAAKKALE